jgi:hypothetical protein
MLLNKYNIILVCFTKDVECKIDNKKEKFNFRESFKNIKLIKYI